MIATNVIGIPEIILGIVVILFIGVLIDILKGKKKNTIEKIVWTLLVVLFPAVGLIIYLSVGRQEKFLYRVLNNFNSAKN